MDWLKWLEGATLAWYESSERSLILPCLVKRNGKQVPVRFKVDTGAAETLVPLDLVGDLVSEEEYERRRQPTGLRNVRLDGIQGARFDDMEIEFSMKPPFTESSNQARTSGGLWVSHEAKGGLLGMSFLRRYGLLVFNFPEIAGLIFRGPHFGLVIQPIHCIELEEPPRSGAPGPEP